MMLSYRMAQALQIVRFQTDLGSWKDGRTLRALQTRGLITKVKWSQVLDTYTFKLTKRGVAMNRNLKFNHTAQLKEMLS